MKEKLRDKALKEKSMSVTELLEILDHFEQRSDQEKEDILRKIEQLK